MKLTDKPWIAADTIITTKDGDDVATTVSRDIAVRLVELHNFDLDVVGPRG